MFFNSEMLCLFANIKHTRSDVNENKVKFEVSFELANFAISIVHRILNDVRSSIDCTGLTQRIRWELHKKNTQKVPTDNSALHLSLNSVHFVLYSKVNVNISEIYRLSHECMQRVNRHTPHSLSYQTKLSNTDFKNSPLNLPEQVNFIWYLSIAIVQRGHNIM